MQQLYYIFLSYGGIMKITAETKISEALKMSEKVRNIFDRYNLLCKSCKGSKQDSIHKAVINNGLDEAEFLKELNEAVQ